MFYLAERDADILFKIDEVLLLINWNNLGDFLKGAHTRQSVKFSSICKDHFFYSSLNHTSRAFLSLFIKYERVVCNETVVLRGWESGIRTLKFVIIQVDKSQTSSVKIIFSWGPWTRSWEPQMMEYAERYEVHKC